MKKLILITWLIALSYSFQAQTIVTFKDSHFKYLVMQDLGITNDTILDIDMQRLATFVYHYENINDLTGIEFAVNLKRLDLSRNRWDNTTELKGLSHLAALTKLTYLNLVENNIKDIPDISSLINLDSLILSGNRIDNLSGIAGLTALSYLELRGNKLTKDNFPSLYNLDNLKPVLWLTHNGPGYSYQEIAKLVSQLDKIPMNPDSIKWDLLRSDIDINPEVRIRAAHIDTLKEKFYKLTDDVYLQYRISSVYNTWVDYLYFRNGAILDKTGKFPVLSGSGSVYVWGNLLSSGSYSYTIKGSVLEVKIPGHDELNGFSLVTGELYLTHSGTEVFMVQQSFGFNNMPFPLNKIFKYLNDKDDNDENEYVSFSVGGVKEYCHDRRNHTNTVNYSFNFSNDGTFSFGAFSIKEPKVYYDGSKNKMGGSFKVKIPGSGYDNLASAKTKNISVLVKNSRGDSIATTSLEQLFKEGQGRWWGTKFLELGMDIEFLNGNIDKLILSLTTEIPLGTSGLKITSISGGVDAISTDMKIHAKMDIATSVEVAGFGPVVELKDFGVTIAPLHLFEGSGNFNLFGYPCANGSLKYNAKMGAISLHGDINLGDILIGNVKSSLSGTSFTGVITATIKIPEKLPWSVRFLSNRTLAAATATINNEVISTSMYYHDFSIAQKIVFGKKEFPYFNYYLGTNLQNLHHIFKDGSIEFQVPENTSQILLVTGNDNNLFDFSVISPSNVEYSKENSQYEQFRESLQSTMIIKSPEQGTWKFKTSQQGKVTLNVVKEISPSLGSFSEPATRNSLTDDIVYNVKNMQDTVIVKFYYDTDNKGYDGVQFCYNGYPQQYVLYKPKKIETKFSGNWWPFIKNDLPDGEYFIYASIDDGKNPVVYQYAPGSFYLNWGNFLTTPQGLKTEINNDSIKVSWNETTDTTAFMTTVFYQAINSDETHSQSVYDTNFVFLSHIEKGREYSIWATYMNLKNYEGPVSDTVRAFIKDRNNNNPPHFAMVANDNLIFTTGKRSYYTLEAFDADNDSLFFSVLNDTLGLQVSGNKLFWMPRENQQGVHRILLSVTDKKSTDSIILNVVVYNKDYFEIRVNFLSIPLHKNQTASINVRNAFLQNQTLLVTVVNSRTKEVDTLTCLKSSQTEYRGTFYLNHLTNNSDLKVLPLDTLIVYYQYGDSTYTDSAVYELQSNLSVKKTANNLPGFKVYPTISGGRINTIIPNLNHVGADLYIYNVQGKQVLVINNIHSHKRTINLQKLTVGLYFIKVVTPFGSATRKIIIKK